MPVVSVLCFLRFPLVLGKFPLEEKNLLGEGVVDAETRELRFEPD